MVGLFRCRFQAERPAVRQNVARQKDCTRLGGRVHIARQDGLKTFSTENVMAPDCGVLRPSGLLQFSRFFPFWESVRFACSDAGEIALIMSTIDSGHLGALHGG